MTVPPAERTDQPAALTFEEIGLCDQIFVDPWLGEHLGAEDIPINSLSRRLGLDESTVSHWIHGRRPVPIHWLRTVARVLKMQVDELVGHARIVEDGYYYANRGSRTVEALEPREGPLRYYVPKAVDRPLPVAPVGVLPSQVKLRWCRCGPGARLHHHGIAQVYGPVGRIADFV